MKKIWSREAQHAMKITGICFFTGLVLGTVFANLAFPYRGGESEVLGLYVMEQLKERKIASGDYFVWLLQHRCRAYLFLAVAGMTAAARPVAVLGMGIMGFLAGAAGSMAVLQYGLWGLGIFLAAQFPQVLVYLPVMTVFLAQMYQKNGKFWKRGEQIRSYFLTALLCLAGWLAGVLLETFLNPGFLSWVFSFM